MWDVFSGVAEVAWDVLSGVAKMAWDVLSGVTKTAWDVLSGVTKTARDVLSGVAKNGMGCFVPGVLSYIHYCIKSFVALKLLRKQFFNGGQKHERCIDCKNTSSRAKT